jgi:toxin ParE1/3/4
MNGRIITRPRAALDIAEQIAWYSVNTSREVSDRFRRAVEQTGTALLEMPGIGVPRHQRNRRLAGLRMHPVRDFEKHLVFYRPIVGGIELVRVLHSARDISAILGQER